MTFDTSEIDTKYHALLRFAKVHCTPLRHRTKGKTTRSVYESSDIRDALERKIDDHLNDRLAEHIPLWEGILDDLEEFELAKDSE